jgi:hypothetical protein
MTAYRNKDEVKELLVSLDEDLQRIPRYDVFGDSNEESIKDLALCIDELHYFLDHEEPRDLGTEVGYWLQGKPSSMEDYTK